MSFSLGRPDSVGLDEYHNRRHPPIVDSEISIIPCMIPFARITRRVSTHIYLSGTPIIDKIPHAYDIEADMDAWVNSLPEKIRPVGVTSQRSGMMMLQDPKWARRQRLVLHLRKQPLAIANCAFYSLTQPVIRILQCKDGAIPSFPCTRDQECTTFLASIGSCCQQMR